MSKSKKMTKNTNKKTDTAAKKPMNRRDFLTLSTAFGATAVGTLALGTLTLGTGCSRQPVVDANELRLQKQTRDQHLAQLKAVPVNSQYQTAKPTIDILDLDPDFRGLTKITHRLHPRYSEEPEVTESKLGGKFLWPADEPWPKEPKTNLPYQPILQLFLQDAPPQFQFLDRCDLMQVLWLPTPNMQPIIAWRRLGLVGSKLIDMPKTDNVLPNYVPVPCRLFPERVAEWPSIDIVQRIEPNKIKDVKQYEETLSTVQGTKVGGYCPDLKADDSPTCSHCKRGLDYMLTIDSTEWTHERWQPTISTKDSPLFGTKDDHLKDHGLILPNAAKRVNFFVCRRCENWPIKVTYA
jgi:hypothetical protein